MPNTMQVFVLLFFAMFQLLGGVFFGLGVRGLLAGSSKGAGALISGAVFGGAGTFASAAFLSTINPWLFWIEVAVLACAVLASAFMPQERIQEIGAGTIVAIVIGLIVMAMAALIGAEAFRRDEMTFGLLWGGCAGFVGLGFLLSGLSALLSGKSLSLRAKAPGEYEIVPTEDGEAESNKPKHKPKK